VALQHTPYSILDTHHIFVTRSGLGISTYVIIHYQYNFLRESESIEFYKSIAKYSLLKIIQILLQKQNKLYLDVKKETHLTFVFNQFNRDPIMVAVTLLSVTDVEIISNLKQSGLVVINIL